MRGHLFPAPDGEGVFGPSVIHHPPARAWSAEAADRHAARRLEAARLVSELEALGFSRVGLVDGVAVAMQADDPRPGWSLGEEAAVALFTAQIAWLELEGG